MIEDQIHFRCFFKFAIIFTGTTTGIPPNRTMLATPIVERMGDQLSVSLSRYIKR
jgi:hypothetical protein